MKNILKPIYSIPLNFYYKISLGLYAFDALRTKNSFGEPLAPAYNNYFHHLICPVSWCLYFLSCFTFLVLLLIFLFLTCVFWNQVVFCLVVYLLNNLYNNIENVKGNFAKFKKGFNERTDNEANSAD